MPEANGGKPTSASLFVTCLLDALFPDVAQAVVDVLEAQGVKVRVPAGQTCCGQPAFNAGYWDEAREMARHTIDVFGDGDDPVVIPSGSCGHAVEHYYPELLRDDPEYGPRAEALAGRIVEFTQFMVDVLGAVDIGARWEGNVVYHPSCHLLRGMHIDGQPHALLEHVEGLNVLDQADPQTCCGFGGVFAVKMGDISGAMMHSRLDAFEGTGADLVVGCDISCLMHIEGGLRKRGSAMRTKHLALLLAEGIRS
jgi:L-lactate dehydrogenase complex protein LldE